MLPTALPSDATLTRWRAPDGWDHRRFDWPSPGRRGRVLVQGGRSDVVEKYLDIAAHLHGRGWSVTSFDWRGQGGSGRLGADGVGHMDRFDAQIGDLVAFWREWAAAEGPHVLLTHSMGAHFALQAMAAGAFRPDAAVLSAPMVQVRSPLGQALGGRVAAWQARRGDPARAAWKFSDESAALERKFRRLTVDKSRGQDSRWWQADGALKLGPPSWGWIAEAFRAGQALVRDTRLAEVQVPTLFLIADHDRLVRPAAAVAVAKRMPRAEVVRFGPESAHEILREGMAVRDRAFAAIDRFLDEQVPA
jgi:lysophospholipase